MSYYVAHQQLTKPISIFQNCLYHSLYVYNCLSGTVTASVIALVISSKKIVCVFCVCFLYFLALKLTKTLTVV